MLCKRNRHAVFFPFANMLKRFKAFGPVKYARIVMDPISNRSRGTGFVCFYRDEDAQKVLEESDKLVSTNPAPVCNLFVLHLKC